MRPALANAILRIYGDSPALDPMAGTGTTLVEAVSLGMHAIGVELEEKYMEMANENIQTLQQPFNKRTGSADCLRGDARNLSTVIPRIEFNSILFSPPYFNCIEGNSYHNSTRKIGLREAGYSLDPSNIGNIKEYGSFSSKTGVLLLSNC